MIRHVAAGAVSGLVVAVAVLSLAILVALEVKVLRCRTFDDPYGGSNVACSVAWRRP